jgi:ketosteroid isomerase-like protein
MPSQPGEGHPQRPMRRQYSCPMPASLELVKIALQAYGNGDCEIALALADPLIRWDERASRPDGDLVWKHEDVQRAMRRYLDSWESYSFEVEDLAEVGPGKVVAICRESGKPKDGSPVDRRFGGLWVVDHGKIASWVTYLTPREAVRAAKELLGGSIDQGQIKRRTGAVTPPEDAERVPEPAAEPAPSESAPAEPAPAEPAPAEPAPAEPSAPERPRNRPLTKSEEQKRAAKARAKLRRRASQQTA